jgi:hypothetical protein
MAAPDEINLDDLRVHVRDVVLTACVVLVTVVIVGAGTAALTDPPTTTTERPVARVTVAELREMNRLLARIEDDPDRSPAERRVATQGREVVDAIENGEVTIVERASPAAPTTAPPSTTTTTTTTTTVPTTRPPPATWPGRLDAPPVDGLAPPGLGG